jgi:hypothetical protein
MSEQDHDWLYMANLTHKTQVAEFNFCLCEEGEQFPYEDCPHPCLDCGMPVTYILEPYGDGMMATIKCTGTCGVSYDTNLEQGVDY